MREPLSELCKFYWLLLNYLFFFRVDDLYRFIHAWVPSLYGELDEEYWRERGYILSDTDTDLSPELTPRGIGESGDNDKDKEGDELGELGRESWEVSSSDFITDSKTHFKQKVKFFMKSPRFRALLIFCYLCRALLQKWWKTLPKWQFTRLFKNDDIACFALFQIVIFNLKLLFQK